MQLTALLIIVGSFAILGFLLSLSVKKHNEKMAKMKKKKGRSRYMPEYKKPGK